MIWVLLALVAAAFVGWRLGFRWLVGAAGAVWLAGLVGLLLSGAFAGPRAGQAEAWAVGGAVLLLILGYGAIVGVLRRAAAGSEPQAAPFALGALADPLPQIGPTGTLSDAELDRYARHIVLRELGGAGQRRLRGARVLVVGAGGLGAPVLQYLAAAGVGRITIADDDEVGLSNLQRQVIFATGDVGRPKAEAAADAIGGLNPHVAATAMTRRITDADAEFIGQHDLVLDGTDSFASRTAVNAACVAAGIPLIAGAITQWEGQVALYDPARGGPCFACIFPEAPAAGLALSCAEAGVVGALPGVIGSIMALEAIKLVGGVTESGAGRGLRGEMLLFDGLWGDTRRIQTAARAVCPVCGGKGRD